MYKAPSKKTLLLRRIAVYGLMTTGVIAVVTLLVLVMLGYRFNRDTNTVQQGGLVQFDSRPTDVNVRIGTANLANLTPSKITVNPGNYDVSMTKNGYVGWTKNVDVVSGQVLWLNYAKLLPQDTKMVESRTFTNVQSVKSSPNGELFAVLQDASKSDVTIVDVTGATSKSVDIKLPNDILPTGKVTYDIQSWSFDSKRILMTATVGKKTEWLLVNRTDVKDSVNLTKTYDSGISTVKADPRGSERVVYISDSGQLRSIDTGSDTLSPVLATDVEQFSYMNDSAIFFVQRPSKTERVVSYISLGKTKMRELKRFETSSRVLVDAATYFGDPYVLMTNGTEATIEKLRQLPESDSTEPITMSTITDKELSAEPAYATMRSGGRFAAFQYEGGVDVYDMELDKHTVTSLEGTSEELRWFDRYHFYLTDGKTLRILEFDGGNPGVIAPLTTRFDSVMTANGKYVYSFEQKQDKSFALNRSQIIAD